MAVKRMRNAVGLTEASRLIGISVTRLMYLVDSGRLPAVRDPVGRRILRRDAVERFARVRAQHRPQQQITARS